MDEFEIDVTFEKKSGLYLAMLNIELSPDFGYVNASFMKYADTPEEARADLNVMLNNFAVLLKKKAKEN